MEPRTLPEEVFARLAPEVFLERLLDENRRPAGRGFEEPREVSVKSGVCENDQALGSAIVRAGSSTVICGITGSVTQLPGEGGIYANVEIHRGGRNGYPTHEEMAVTQYIQSLIEASKIPSDQFIIGRSECVLHAQLIVLSRTGPPVDLLWTVLVAALKDTKIPIWKQDDRTDEWLPTNETVHLDLGQLPTVHKSLGLYRGRLFSDLDGSVEERCINDRISYSKNGENFTSISLTCPSGIKWKTLESVLTSK